MTDTEILERAIDKATKNGWNKPFGSYDFIDLDPITGELKVFFTYKNSNPYSYSVSSIIYDKEFAKAIWGEYTPENTLIINGKKYGETSPKWEYHLQQMASSDNPIQYLGANLYE